MAGKDIIVIGAILALLASFFIIISMLTVPGDLYVGGNLNVTGTGEFGGNIDMNENYILYSDFCHWIHFTMTGGQTDITINTIPAGVLTQDRYYHRLTFAVDAAPGGAKECNVSLSDGTNSMIVALTGGATSGYTTNGSFALDVSAETLTLKYSQDAGGEAGKGFITIKYHYKENE